MNSAKVDLYQDKVKLTEGGWKERYYAEKFGVNGKEQLDKFRKDIRQAYIEGLCWVYKYYYNGCASWCWFYPYHYAPFSSDLLGCDRLKIEFELSEPVTPYEQLLSVFPRQSRHALPKCYHHLYDPDSEIIDFYPSEVSLDINGARYAWMGVNILPFIDRSRLVKAMKEADGNGEKLTPHERDRNKPSGDIKIYFRQNMFNAESALLQKLKENPKVNTEIMARFVNKDTFEGKAVVPDLKSGMASNTFPIGATVEKQVGRFEVKVEKCDCFVLNLTHPTYKVHLTQLLPNVQMPRREVEDFAIFHIKRRHFQGEEAIRIVERVLKIDASQDPVYQFGGRTNFSGQQYGSYTNGRAMVSETGLMPGSFQAMPQLGVKRRYEEYSSGYPQENHVSYAQKRLNTGAGYSNVYADQPLNRPQINYNIGGRGGFNQGGTSSIRENYERQIAQAN